MSSGSTTRVPEIKRDTEANHTQVRHIGPKSDDGMFVLSKIGDVRAKFVIDTGSCVTILNYDTYKKISPEVKPALKKSNIILRTADDNPLNSHC